MNGSGCKNNDKNNFSHRILGVVLFLLGLGLLGFVIAGFVIAAIVPVLLNEATVVAIAAGTIIFGGIGGALTVGGWELLSGGTFAEKKFVWEK